MCRRLRWMGHAIGRDRNTTNDSPPPTSITSVITRFMMPPGALVTSTPSLLLAAVLPLCCCCSQQQLRSCCCVSKLRTPAPAAAVGMLPAPGGMPSAAKACLAHLIGSSSASLTSGGRAAAALSADAEAACRRDSLHTCSLPCDSPTATSALGFSCCRSRQLMGEVLELIRKRPVCVGAAAALRQTVDSCCCCAACHVLREGGARQPNCCASSCWQWLAELQAGRQAKKGR